MLAPRTTKAGSKNRLLSIKSFAPLLEFAINTIHVTVFSKFIISNDIATTPFSPDCLLSRKLDMFKCRRTTTHKLYISFTQNPSHCSDHASS